MTNNYLNARKENDKKTASRIAVNKSIPSILTSGGILVCAAFLLKWCSSIKAVSEMGGLIGRGALISMFLVIFFLPHVLSLFDKAIEETKFRSVKKSKTKEKVTEEVVK